MSHEIELQVVQPVQAEALRHRLTDSRDSDAGSRIQVHQRRSLPGGNAAMEEGGETDEDDGDVFDELEGPMGGIYKLPSALSIEARAGGSWGGWSSQHSRVPSAVRLAALKFDHLPKIRGCPYFTSSSNVSGNSNQKPMPLKRKSAILSQRGLHASIDDGRHGI